MAELGLTPIFEMTSPRCSIIVQYDADALTLLHVRENVSGRYLSEQEINQLKCPFPLVETVSGKFEGFLNADSAPTECGFRWDLMKEAVEHTTGIESWVIQFNDGNMVKVKTAWYQSLTHGGRDVTSLRWCDIARAVVEGTADDTLLSRWTGANLPQSSTWSKKSWQKSRRSLIELTGLLLNLYT